MPRYADIVKLLSDAVSPETGTSHRPVGSLRTIHASGLTSSGSGTAEIEIQVSNDGEDWMRQGTITLALSDSISGDGYATNAPWKLMRAKLNSISGTGAKVTVTLSTVGN